MLRIIIISLLVLGGCQTSQTTEEIASDTQISDLDNPWLSQAEQDVVMARDQGVEWRVRDVVTDNNAVNLSELLIIARELQLAGDNAEATRLSIKISQLVVLALQQANDNKNALPKYPENF